MVLIVESPGHAVIEERRSRFIADICAVATREDIASHLAGRRSEYPDASHIVHAFRLGPPASQTLGMSDDHEPHGTAGRPILDVLTGRGITNALVTVVRYFGGTKLGTGGLVRAYSEAARRAIEDANLAVFRNLRPICIITDYRYLEQLRRVLEESGGKVEDAEYGTAVTLAGAIPATESRTVMERIADLTRGEAVVELGQYDDR